MSDDEKPKEDFCIAEDGVVESFVTWDLGFASQEALQRKKLLNSIIGRNDLLWFCWGLGFSWREALQESSCQSDLIWGDMIWYDVTKKRWIGFNVSWYDMIWFWVLIYLHQLCFGASPGPPLSPCGASWSCRWAALHWKDRLLTWKEPIERIYDNQKKRPGWWGKLLFWGNLVLTYFKKCP